MVKIAFGYKRRVGKDTSCDYLVQKYGGVKLSFAEPLYKILNFSQLICNFKETKDRKFLQFVGTEWARSINENVWVDLLIDKLKSRPEVNIFVSDLRFKNEFWALKKHGFICVQVKNKEVDHYSDSLAKGENGRIDAAMLPNFFEVGRREPNGLSVPPTTIGCATEGSLTPRRRPKVVDGTNAPNGRIVAAMLQSSIGGTPGLRPFFNRSKTGWKAVDDDSNGYENHQSDYDLDNMVGWDYTIDNIGSVEELYVRLDQMFSQLV